MSTWRRWLPLALIVLAHVCLLSRVISPVTALSAEPILGTDHSLHYYRSVAVGRGFLPSGALWGYDPFHKAGYPAGGVNDLDDKALEVFVGIVGPVLGNGRAFNLCLYLCYAAIPLLYFLAAGSLGLPRGPPLVAAALAAAVWNFAPRVANWVLFGGFGFVMAAACAPPITAFLARLVERGDRRSALLLLATAPLFYFHVHVAGLVAVLGLGLTVPLLRAGRRRTAVALAVTAGIALLNLPWIAPLLSEWEHMRPSAYRESGGGTPLLGFVRHLAKGDVYGLILPLAAGGYGLVRLARDGRRGLVAAWALGALVLLLLAYEGHRVAALRWSLEPSRLRIALPFALVIPAAYGLCDVARRAHARWGTLRPALAAGIVWGALAPWTLLPPATRAFGTAHLGPGLRPAAERLLADLATLGDPAGRVCVEETGSVPGVGLPFGTYIAAMGPLRTGRPWLGGPYWRRFLAHGHAGFVHGVLGARPIDGYTGAELAAFLERYDVTALAACLPASIEHLRTLDTVLTERGEEPPYVLFEVRRTADAFALGAGRVHVDYDRLEVAPSGPGDLVLKWHYDERLTVSPPLVLSREPVGDDPVGFIRVGGSDGRPFVIRMAGRGD